MQLLIVFVSFSICSDIELKLKVIDNFFLQVLFDVVPVIKFQDAIELISMQPIASTAAAWKRCVRRDFLPIQGQK